MAVSTSKLLTRFCTLVQWDWRVTAVASVLLLLYLTRLVTQIQSVLGVLATGSNRHPVRVPYLVPFIGNTLEFGMNGRVFVDNVRKRFGINVPVHLRVLNQNMHLVSGNESMLGLFRKSRDLSTAAVTGRVLERSYGVPVADRKNVLDRDNTGIFSQPLEGSTPLEPHNRYFYLSHKIFHRTLSGSALTDLLARFITLLENEFKSLDIPHDEWTDMPDLYTMIRDAFFRASTTALCGPYLLRLNPDLLDDFFEFDSYITTLFKGIPRWLSPSAYRARDEYHASVKKWLDFAHDNVNPGAPELEGVEYEEYFGARVMRERSVDLDGVDGMSREGRAGDDVGMIWGANANIIPTVGWEIIDILTRPELLARVRTEISKASDGTATGLNMPELMANPLLQSIYTETLRLRASGMVSRTPYTAAFKLGDWVFPKGEMILASAWHEHRDEAIWNTKNNLHSLDTFWADRFLVYPNDPTSGPRKPAADAKPATFDEKPTSNEPKFTTEPVNGSYLPYGGGQKICPGRFYAKAEAISAMALFISMFDVEIAADQKVPEMDMSYFAFGVIPPKGVVRGRIRRRG